MMSVQPAFLGAYYEKIFGHHLMTDEQRRISEQAWETKMQSNKNSWFTFSGGIPLPVAEEAVEYYMLTGKKNWTPEVEERIINSLDASVSSKLNSGAIYEAAEDEALLVLLSGKTTRPAEQLNLMTQTLKDDFVDSRKSAEQAPPHWTVSAENALRDAAYYIILKRQK